MQHVRLPRLSLELLDALFVTLGAQCRDRHRLGLSTREQARAVGARQCSDLDRDLADLVVRATVGAHAVGEHHVAQRITFDVVQQLADVVLLLDEPLRERLLGLGVDAVDLLLA